ncbi:hypothetical protein D083_0360 [Dickeya solani RNS 08.23.3.1.A]|nr:hypothetical protein D083_0360 [Dickeya solani RNS 08.23.3.1.A]
MTGIFKDPVERLSISVKIRKCSSSLIKTPPDNHYPVA